MNLLARRQPAASEEIWPDELPGLWADILIPGGLAGALGGLLTSALAMAIGRIFAGSAWMPLQLVAGLFLRNTPLEQMGGGAAALGLLLHVGMAAGLGVGFAALLPRGGTAVAAIGLAWLYGMGLYVAMSQLVIPYVDPLLAAHLNAGVTFLVYLLFGACLPIVAPARRAAHRLERLRRTVTGVR